MPLLGPADTLPARPRRVLVAGTSGSGKTTLARALAGALDLPHTEIDALFHGADWVRRPEFEADVAALVAGSGGSPSSCTTTPGPRCSPRATSSWHWTSRRPSS